MMRKKSIRKKTKKTKDKIKVDVTKEIGTILDFAIIEKFPEQEKEKKKEDEEKKSEKQEETKDGFIDLSKDEEKNQTNKPNELSFLKNWIIYNKPEKSRFSEFFEELAEDKKKENTPQEEETSDIYDNISSNPSEDNSRDSKDSDEEKKETNISPIDNNNKINKIKIKVKVKVNEEELNLNININNILSKKEKRSTLMIKNIPNKFNQEYILNIINQNFKGTYDVFILPTDLNKIKNFGYAFINFTNSYYIPYFYFMFNGKMWFGTNSKKICELAFAKIQGKEPLVEHYPSKIVFHNEEALMVTPEQKYIIPNIYKLYFNECFPKEKIEEHKYYFVTKIPS